MPLIFFRALMTSAKATPFPSAAGTRPPFSRTEDRGRGWRLMKMSVNAKGQITIPAELRRKYGIEPGTRIAIADNGTSIILKPVTEQLIRQLRGSLKGKGVLKALMQDRLDTEN